MSAGDINDDQKIAVKGRKNTLKEVDGESIEVSLRDQIPKKLKKKLEDLDIGLKIRGFWTRGNGNRREWLDRQKEFLNDWDEFLISTDSGPFEGSSTLHLPTPLVVAKTLHARFLQAVLGTDPSFSTKARSSGSIDQVPVIQETMNYALKKWANRNEGVREAIDGWVWDWVTTGVGVLKIRWDAEFTKFDDIEIIPEAGPDQIVTDDEGNQVSIPTIVGKEREVKRVKKIFEGPVFEPILMEDFLFVGGKGNPQKADFVIHRVRMTASELWTLVDQKIFDEDEVRDVIKRGPNPVQGTENTDIKWQRNDNAGTVTLDQDIQTDRYEILEAYLKVDVDESGIASDVVVWVHQSTGNILRATYLHRINKSGERPFFKADFHLRREQDYGVGIIEMIHPLTVEMDAMHNMRIDFGLISTMPVGFYRPTSGLDPEIISFEPGSLIPVDNPQTDIVFPNMGNRTAFGFNEEAALQTMIERLTGISDLSLGVQSGTQGATRTATGTRALIGELSANLDVHLQRLNGAWTKALQYLLHMLQQRIPNGLSFRITGDEGADYWVNIKTAEDIAGDFDFEVEANSSASNQQIRIQNADIAAQIQADPLAIQLGIVGPRQIYEAKKAQLQARGIKDINRFLVPPQQQRIFTPQEEANRILRGVPTPVTPEADHQGFIAFFEFLQDNDELLENYTQQEFQALAAQAQQHAQMQAALEQQAAQQRNQAQQQANAIQSQSQSAPGLNPVAAPGPVGGPIEGQTQ